jgi:ubiquinol-cytochrome c reductase cytochrome c1 subunit
MNAFIQKFIRVCIAAPLLVSVAAFASGAEVKLDRATVNPNDQASLQRGARNFVQYCLNCHNAQFMRYSHLTGIGLTEEQIKTNLMFTTDKISDPMISALDPNDAKTWLGAMPPDLTVIARSRSPDWLFTFLRSFYQDDKSPSGWNNEVFKNVGMPNPLHELQGIQLRQKVGEKIGHHGPEPVMKLVAANAGTMSTRDYDLFVGDLVNYLAYMAEPHKVARQQTGIAVLFFLVLMFFVTLWLKNEYWKDVK